MHHWQPVSALLTSSLLLIACSTSTPSLSTDALGQSRWILSSLSGQSALAGRRATLNFADGKVEGSAGCNSYSASYTIAGEKISIGQAAATRRWCARPDGLMEQEAKFLLALASAESWRIDGDRLELRDATGALVVSLSAAVPEVDEDRLRARRD
jgi:heat shock protein HslJ